MPTQAAGARHRPFALCPAACACARAYCSAQHNTPHAPLSWRPPAGHRTDDGAGHPSRYRAGNPTPFLPAIASNERHRDPRCLVWAPGPRGLVLRGPGRVGCGQHAPAPDRCPRRRCTPPARAQEAPEPLALDHQRHSGRAGGGGWGARSGPALELRHVAGSTLRAQLSAAAHKHAVRGRRGSATPQTPLPAATRRAACGRGMFVQPRRQLQPRLDRPGQAPAAGPFRHR